MVNFMCQLDRATVCPDSRLNIILGVSVMVFLYEINMHVDYIKKISLLNGGGHHPIH